MTILEVLYFISESLEFPVHPVFPLPYMNLALRQAPARAAKRRYLEPGNVGAPRLSGQPCSRYCRPNKVWQSHSPSSFPEIGMLAAERN